MSGKFLSTPSARRATQHKPCKTQRRYDFYPRPPRGGRLSHQFLCDFWFNISIHALREEGDAQHKSAHRQDLISIHALREEGDLPCSVLSRSASHFYPRPPRGGRRRAKRGKSQAKEFLSTPSARRATALASMSFLTCAISIHALREEGDLVNISLRLCEGQFLSTPSARRATFRPRTTFASSSVFLSTPSARRATECQRKYDNPLNRFLSTPSARRAT